MEPIVGARRSPDHLLASPVSASSHGSADRPKALQSYSRSDPDDAEILVDGRFSGRTPLELQVTRGPHLIEVKKAGFPVMRDRVSVPARSIATFELGKDGRP